MDYDKENVATIGDGKKNMQQLSGDLRVWRFFSPASGNRHINI